MTDMLTQIQAALGRAKLRARNESTWHEMLDASRRWLERHNVELARNLPAEEQREFLAYIDGLLPEHFMSVVGNFVKDAKVTDGLLVAFRNGYLLWAGPVMETPLDSFPEGTDLHVHPALYDRIEKTAAATGEGIPR